MAVCLIDMILIGLARGAVRPTLHRTMSIRTNMTSLDGVLWGKNRVVNTSIRQLTQARDGVNDPRWMACAWQRGQQGSANGFSTKKPCPYTWVMGLVDVGNASPRHHGERKTPCSLNKGKAEQGMRKRIRTCVLRLALDLSWASSCSDDRLPAKPARRPASAKPAGGRFVAWIALSASSTSACPHGTPYASNLLSCSDRCQAPWSWGGRMRDADGHLPSSP